MLSCIVLPAKDAVHVLLVFCLFIVYFGMHTFVITVDEIIWYVRPIHLTTIEMHETLLLNWYLISFIWCIYIYIYIYIFASHLSSLMPLHQLVYSHIWIKEPLYTGEQLDTIKTCRSSIWYCTVKSLPCTILLQVHWSYRFILDLQSKRSLASYS